MGVLRLAQEAAYTLVDRATYLLSNRQHKMRIFIGTEGHRTSGNWRTFLLFLLIGAVP